MSERSHLLRSIAETIADYRSDDLEAPTSQHVNRWVVQFDPEVQVPILREMDHVLKKTYFSLETTWEYVWDLFNSRRLVGPDPCTFWKGVRFLDIQLGGASQKEMLSFFDAMLEEICGFGLDECGADPRAYVYLDDAIFSGGRMRQDLSAWIVDEAPPEARLYVIALATHRSAYYNRRRVREAVRESGKDIGIEWRYRIRLEDRMTYTDSSDVLRPVSIPEDPSVVAYTNGLRRPLRLREPGQVGPLGLFSSDAGRQLLEQEFLKAGVRIRRMSGHFNEYQRPLGNNMLDSLGFGSLIVTFRNCPNYTPLALWAGDPWYPLFPRTTNRETASARTDRRR